MAVTYRFYQKKVHIAVQLTICSDLLNFSIYHCFSVTEPIIFETDLCSLQLMYIYNY